MQAAEAAGVRRRPAALAGPDEPPAPSHGGAAPGRSAAAAAGLAAQAEAARRAAARRAARRKVSFDIRISLFSLAMHGGTQVVSLLSWASLPPGERAQRCLSILYACIPVALPVLAPEFYLAWRAWVYTFYRVGFFLWPLLRKPRGIQRVLDDPPLPGARGAAKSLAKTIWGSRLVAVMASAAMTPLSFVPLVPQLLLQIYSVAMVRANHTLCSTVLLSHPLTKQRIQSFHSTMHLLALVLPGGIGSAVAPRLRGSSEAQECEAFLSFIFITTGLLLPLAVLVKTEPPLALRAWEARRAARRSAAAAGAPSKRSLRAALEGLLFAIEGGVRELCGRSWLGGDPPAEEGPAAATAAAGGASRWPCFRLCGWQRAVAWWLVLSFCWAAAVEHHLTGGSRAAAA